MFKAVEDTIIEVLKQAGINAQVWSGDKEELFKLPRTLPAVRMILEKADFVPISSHAYSVSLGYSFLVFFRSIRDDATGAYAVIENILSLIVHKTDYFFTPKEITLLYHENGEFCYKVDGTCSYTYVVPDVLEPVVKRITTFEGEELISDVISPNP